jgi:ATP-dependent DNA ligase
MARMKSEELPGFIKPQLATLKAKAPFGEPAFFADVEYRDITSEGLLRQSSFKGLKRN